MATIRPPAGRQSRGSRPGRAAWGTISRERIVEAALKAASIGGLEQLTIRSLASDLGVAPMSLYRHVRGKDDLLDEVVDRLLRSSWRPERETYGWRDWMVATCDKLRELLVSQPAALHVYLRHPVVAPAAMARMGEILERLRLAGFAEHEARRAYGAVQTYTIGFAALEASRAGWIPSEEEQHSLAGQLAAYTSPEQFVIGLDYLLEGIEHGASLRRAPS